jgi:predicted nucleotidyltransferase
MLKAREGRIELEQKLQTQLPEQAMNAIASRFPIAEFCQRWQIKEFYLFGSVLREDFRSDSDIDIMVSFEVDAPWGLLEFVRMKRDRTYAIAPLAPQIWGELDLLPPRLGGRGGKTMVFA